MSPVEREEGSSQDEPVLTLQPVPQTPAHSLGVHICTETQAQGPEMGHRLNKGGFVLSWKESELIHFDSRTLSCSLCQASCLSLHLPKCDMEIIIHVSQH